jgi:uncharacterized protein with PIN domain
MEQPPDAPIRFILDDASGSLLKWLRMLGFDAIYRRECKKPVTEKASKREIYLTQSKSVDRNKMETVILLEQGSVTAQLHYVMAALSMTREKVNPFSRCIICNRATQIVDKRAIRGKIPDFVWETHEMFRECPECGRIYWRGTHAEKISKTLQRIFEGVQGQGFE